MSTEMFDKGLQVRREVLGAEYVDGSMRSANDFMMAFQDITTQWCPRATCAAAIRSAATA
ncbi:hypothetical protein AZ14_4665 [Bordetella bronchiseptica 980]|nr:hypothetical protein AZ14_4665 [Bordetella bronchiseptica 980]